MGAPVRSLLPLFVLAGACAPEGLFEPTRVEGLQPAAALALGDWHSCALLQNGNLGCWGRNHAGQLGVETPDDHVTKPTWVPLPADPVEIAASSQHGCALLEDGSVHCWGEGSAGQLGIDVSCPDFGRCPVTPARVAGVDGAVALAAGGEESFDADGTELYDVSFTCAIDADASVLCWGVNHSGQLGAGDAAAHAGPVTVLDGDGFPIRDIVALDAGGAHACAVDASGNIWCWGDASFGKGGGGVAAARVGGITGALDIATGSDHSCALLIDGGVACWGWNLNGQAGDSLENDYCGGDYADCLPAPRPVDGVSGAKQVAAGERHSCALLEGGRVMCWGSNQVGQLGVTAPGLDREASLVPLPSVAIDLDAGSAHTCAILDNGDVACWGSVSFGQVGSELP